MISNVFRWALIYKIIYLMTDEAILFACQPHSIMFENGQLSEVRSRHEYSDGFKGIKSVLGY